MLRCPMCGGENFDQMTRQLSTGHTVWYGEPGKSGAKTRVWARACMNCGYVVSFVDVEKLLRRFGQPQSDQPPAPGPKRETSRDET